MKKQVLLSVFAAALFASPVALANDGVHTSADDNATSLKGADLFGKRTSRINSIR